MSSKEQDIKKQLEQQREQLQRAEQERALLAQQEAARLAQMPQSQQQTDETDAVDAAPVVVIKPVVSETAKDDWQKILNAYRDLYPDSPIKDNCLVFASQDDARTFFDNQAKLLRTFFAQEFVNDKASGFHFFSCGNGVLYSGSIGEIHQQLLSAQKDNPSAHVEEGLAFIAKQMVSNPAVNFRSALNEQREELADEINAAKNATSSPKSS